MSHKKVSSDTAAPVIPFPEPLLVTTAHAVELLSISTWEVRRLVRKGLLTHKRLSKTHWLIPLKSVRAFAEVSSKGRASPGFLGARFFAGPAFSGRPPTCPSKMYLKSNIPFWFALRT